MLLNDVTLALPKLLNIGHKVLYIKLTLRVTSYLNDLLQILTDPDPW